MCSKFVFVLNPGLSSNIPFYDLKKNEMLRHMLNNTMNWDLKSGHLGGMEHLRTSILSNIEIELTFAF